MIDQKIGRSVIASNILINQHYELQSDKATKSRLFNELPDI